MYYFPISIVFLVINFLFFIMFKTFKYILLFISLLGISIFLYGYYLQKESPEKITNSDECIHSIKEKIGNITIIRPCTGDGYQKGFEYGELMKNDLEEVVEILNEEVISHNEVKKFLIKTYLLQKAFSLEKFIPEQYIQEMKGIADGANVDYADILLINTYDDLLYLSGCSSLAGTVNETNNDFFHARNLDYPIKFLAGKTVLVESENTILIGFPGYIGALTAINKHTGLTLSSHTSFSKDVQKGMPTGFLYRKIIEEAQNLAESKNILETEKRTIGNNLLVSSLKDNKISLLEFSSNTLAETLSDDFSFITNHFVSDKFLYNASPNSVKRYNQLKNFSQYNKKEYVKNLANIQKLFSTYDGNKKGWSSLANIGTVQSIVIFPRLKKIYLAKGEKTPVSDAGYFEFNY